MGAAALLAIGAFAAYVALGMQAHARYAGTISGLSLHARVRILRDDRGVPHILASDAHDLFFAQGYVEASDRLFQMDLLRHFVEGRLAEIFGPPALRSDVVERAVPVRAIVAAQWTGLDRDTRSALMAFTGGVNAAMQREPLPVEFRLLAYRPQPWTPQDTLAVGMATVLDLIDDWNAIAPRDSAYRRGGAAAEARAFPLSDPCYDAPVLGGLAALGPGKRCSLETLVRELGDARPPVGSNEWAAGAAHSATGRALLANDPHLALSIPGVWYLVDLRAPGFHAAGATFPGSPGVVLGHNDRIAWAATDGTVASLSVFDPPSHLPGSWESERFGVRFGPPVVRRYYRDPHAFGIPLRGGRFVLVRWSAYDHPEAPAPTFLRLDRAASLKDAIGALATFPGPTQNFALADSSGRVAYALAGRIPDDPVWARWFHRPGDLSRSYPPIPFALLPKIAPSRTAIVWTANNRMYPRGYPRRLSPQFAPPYRAYRIAQLLRARATYDVAYFAHMQMDALSLPELELVTDLAPQIRAADPQAAATLRGWNGEMAGLSLAPALAQALRTRLTGDRRGRIVNALFSARRSAGTIAVAPFPSPQPWDVAGSVTVTHALASLGIAALDGTTLPGRGDAYTLHVQYPGYSQSFRAVWEAGNWDAGGITLPQGESGEPGSRHYVDEAQAWVSGRLWPLPYSDAAVERTAVDRETLEP